MLALAFAIWRYHATLGYLNEAEFANVNVDRLDQLPGWQSPYVVAMPLTLIGVGTYLWIFLRG